MLTWIIVAVFAVSIYFTLQTAKKKKQMHEKKLANIRAQIEKNEKAKEEKKKQQLAESE